jgi:hypothetical protein
MPYCKLEDRSQYAARARARRAENIAASPMTKAYRAGFLIFASMGSFYYVKQVKSTTRVRKGVPTDNTEWSPPFKTAEDAALNALTCSGNIP